MPRPTAGNPRKTDSHGIVRGHGHFWRATHDAGGSTSVWMDAPMATLRPTFSRSTRMSAAIFLGIFSIMALRTWPALTLPVLGHEDGRELFAFYFNHPSPTEILRYYGGYVSLVPNAIGWAAMRLPLPLSPYVFSLASLLLATIGFYLFSGDGHAWLIPEARTRLIIAMTLVLLPLGKSYLVTNLMYSQWSLLFLLVVLLSRWPLPRSSAALIAYVVSVALCTASHPLSLLAAPLCLVQFFYCNTRQQRLAVMLCFLAIIAYHYAGIMHGKDIDVSLESILWAMKVFITRVVFESVLGARATTLLAANGGLHYIYAGAFLILCLLANMIRTSERRLRETVLTAGVIALAFGIVQISTLVRYVGPEARLIHLENPFLQRYIYVPKLIFTAFLLSQLVPRLQRYYSRFDVPQKTVFLALCGAYILGISGDNQFLYRGSRSEGLRVKSFVESSYTDLLRARKGESHRVMHTLSRDDGWDIVLLLGAHNEDPSAIEEKKEEGE